MSKKISKIYTEIGFGNETFINTELEYDDETEVRMSGFFNMKKEHLYFRFWLFKKVFILSTKDGFVIQTKDRNKLKILFGIAGSPLN